MSGTNIIQPITANGLPTGEVAVLKHYLVRFSRCKFNEIMFIYPLHPLLRQLAVITSGFVLQIIVHRATAIEFTANVSINYCRFFCRGDERSHENLVFFERTFFSFFVGKQAYLKILVMRWLV